MEENSNENLQAEKTAESPRCRISKFFIWATLAILLVTIIVLGYFVFEMQKANDELSAANETLNQEKQSLQEEKTALGKKVSELEAANEESLNKIAELSQKVTVLEKENMDLTETRSSVCTKENSCKFRSPGSAFRCDESLKYDAGGSKWCECDVNCDVVAN